MINICAETLTETLGMQSADFWSMVSNIETEIQLLMDWSQAPGTRLIPAKSQSWS